MQLFIQKWRIWRLQQSTFKVRRQCGFQHCCKTWMLNFANLMSRLIPFWGQLGTCSCHFTILSFHQPRFLPEERYNHQSRTDPSVTPWKSVPNGWEIAEAFDEVIEKARSLGLWIQFYPEWAWVLFQVATAKMFLLESLSWSTSTFLSINLHWTRAGH